MRAKVAKKLRRLVGDEYDGCYLEPIQPLFGGPIKHHRLMNPFSRKLTELKNEWRTKGR